MITVTAATRGTFIFSAVRFTLGDRTVYLAIKISLAVSAEIRAYLTAPAHGHVFIFPMHDLTALETLRQIETNRVKREFPIDVWKICF